MRNYRLEDFKEDIRTNREFEITYHEKMYSLTYTKEGFIFTDDKECVEAIYNSYYDLLKSIRIEGKSIEEIISENIYDDLCIY